MISTSPNARFLCVAIQLTFCSLAFGQNRFSIQFLDEETNTPIAARFEFTPPAKRPFKPKGALSQGRYILVEGETDWTPPTGLHRFRLSRGPEFDVLLGEFTVEEKADDSKPLTIRRRTDLRQEGWYSGDLLSLLPTAPLVRWQRADELDMAVSVAPSSPSTAPSEPSRQKKSSLPSVDPRCMLDTRTGYWDRRDGGGLLIHGWKPMKPPTSDQPSGQLLVEAKKGESSLIEIQSLASRDTPIWLASKRVDAIQVLSTHLSPMEGRGLQGVYNPDPIRFSGNKGLGRLTEYLYWQILETGLRIPPSAGSGFGDSKLDTHLGYNRVYVHLEEPISPEAWWEGWKQGRSFVTNGPLLRATIHGNYPGHVFTASSGEKIDLEIDLQLGVRDPVEYLDVVFNGQSLYQARLEVHAKKGKFPPLEIKESGWLILRVVTEHEESYRLAMTSPFYFEFDGAPRVSRKAVRLFQEWLDVSSKSLKSEATKKMHQPYFDAANKFWDDRLQKANTD